VTIDTSQNVTFVGSQTLSAGTANGVAYLNGSKVVTSGSALTFDGTSLSNTRSVATAYSGSNAATWSNGIVLTNNATPSTGVASLINFGGTANVNSVFGVAQGSSGFGDFVWAGYAGSFSEQMRLTSTGLGIGTSSPAHKLDIATASGDCVIRLGNGTSQARFAIDSDGPYIYALTSGDNALRVFTPAGSQAMTLDSSGNLGVGTTSPSQRIHASAVDPRALLASTGTGHSAWQCQNTSGSSYFGRDNAGGSFFGTANATVVYSSSADPITFYTSTTERARIDSSGNLLIGTTTSSGSGITLANFKYIYSIGTYNNTTGAAANMGVDSTAGVFYRSTSSLKYKRDVRDYDKGLATLMTLRSVYYKGTSERDGDTQYAGLIAEEVHDAGLPEFVQYAEDGTPDALAYGHMVSLLTKAIQEQQALIETLTQRITALEGR
jgi:hypothetical protein